jgi:hypothetical protein
MPSSRRPSTTICRHSPRRYNACSTAPADGSRTRSVRRGETKRRNKGQRRCACSRREPLFVVFCCRLQAPDHVHTVEVMGDRGPYRPTPKEKSSNGEWRSRDLGFDVRSVGRP